MGPSRRSVVAYSGILGLSPLLPGCGDGDDSGSEPPRAGADPFLHGVASGDPASDGFVLWTRVSLEELPASVELSWVVAADPALSDVVQSGSATTDPERDYTVNVEVTGLEPGTTYYYRFSSAGHDSPVGRARTLPAAIERLRLALVSCSSHAAGYFNAYAAVALRPDLDAVLHLGDYIYEYGPAEFGDAGLRPIEPPHEIVTLDDYRTRHAQYKRDPDSQEAHRQHTFIVVWDDHEVSNNAWRDGAQNHDPATEGDYQTRKAAATRAYLEWMPVRRPAEQDPLHIYRSFRFGDLVDLMMLDTRHLGRDEQVADACDKVAIADPERQLLGSEQEAWLFAELSASKQRGTSWRLLGQQVMVGQLVNKLLPGDCIISTDQWDGYPAARARLFTHLAENAIDNVAVLTGDIHCSWAIDLTPDPFDPTLYDAATGSGSLAVEFVTPSITSPAFEASEGTTAFAEVVRDTHPHVKFVELSQHGYVILDVTAEAIQAEWYHVVTILEPSSAETMVAMQRVASGANHLVPAESATSPKSDAPDFAP